MSLRSFHILFISISVAVAVGFGAWLGGEYLRDGGVPVLLAIGGCLLAAASLAVYAVRFSRKTRNLAGTGIR